VFRCNNQLLSKRYVHTGDLIFSVLQNDCDLLYPTNKHVFEILGGTIARLPPTECGPEGDTGRQMLNTLYTAAQSLTISVIAYMSSNI